MGGMFGGSGTTANTFAYLLWATFQQPYIVKKLRAELEEAFDSNARTVPLASVRLKSRFARHLSPCADY